MNMPSVKERLSEIGGNSKHSQVADLLENTGDVSVHTEEWMHSLDKILEEEWKTIKKERE